MGGCTAKPGSALVRRRGTGWVCVVLAEPAPQNNHIAATTQVFARLASLSSTCAWHAPADVYAGQPLTAGHESLEAPALAEREVHIPAVVFPFASAIPFSPTGRVSRTTQRVCAHPHPCPQPFHRGKRTCGRSSVQGAQAHPVVSRGSKRGCRTRRSVGGTWCLLAPPLGQKAHQAWCSPANTGEWTWDCSAQAFTTCQYTRVSLENGHVTFTKPSKRSSFLHHDQYFKLLFLHRLAFQQQRVVIIV